MAASCNKSVLDVKPVFRLINPMAWWQRWDSNHTEPTGLLEAKVISRYMDYHKDRGWFLCDTVHTFMPVDDPVRAVIPHLWQGNVPCAVLHQHTRLKTIIYRHFSRTLMLFYFHTASTSTTIPSSFSVVSPRAHTIRRPSHVVS